MSEQSSRDSIADIWGPRTPYGDIWPTRPDVHVTAEPERWVPGACMLCSNGCGLDIGVRGNQIVGVRGREDDGINRGRLGPKGLNGWMANSSPDRLKQPLIRRNGKLQPASWDEAMSLIVARSQETRRDYSAGAMAFYNTGQLMLEEYYTLALIAFGGLGTTNIDGNTRLCTATAEAALRESFGTDGQPGCYEDFDTADVLFHFGHNVAYTHTVLWARILDRLSSPNPPRLLVADPRRTETARAAHLHLALRSGTNLALMNGLLHLLLRNGHTDNSFIENHTVGLDQLAETTARYTPKRVAQICDIPVAQLEQAAEMLGTTPRLLSTVLQGVYQSAHATAAAVQVNNLHLIRGMIGKPGCSVFQMNGQPSAQNTRECGASASFPAMSNRQNAAHVRHIAEVWNVRQAQLPTYAEPTHAMEIFRRAESGSVRFLWILSTNPAASIPDIERIRRILGKPGLFVVVQDAFLTETTDFADVVLPAAIWGEKTGTITNTDRTVHLCQKAIEPPGEARSDFDILLDYAQRMGFRDKDGDPLVKWTTPEQAFDAWRQMTVGRPCDYSGMTYARLAANSGLRWPCNEQYPEGKPRLYPDGQFPTEPEVCQGFGYTLLSGGEISEAMYRKQNPHGRAHLKAADYEPPEEAPDASYPFAVTTGRLAYQFHTRTKTGRSAPLQNAAPEPFVQIAELDAKALFISEDDLVEIRTRRGHTVAKARLGDIRPGHIFMPFHFGTSDRSGNDGVANELTFSGWDPVSKQPHLKTAAGQLRKLKDEANNTLLRDNVQDIVQTSRNGAHKALAVVKSMATSTRPGQHVPLYLGRVQAGEQSLTAAYHLVGERHKDSEEIKSRCQVFAMRSQSAQEVLQPLALHYKPHPAQEGQHLLSKWFSGPRHGNMGMLEDLHEIHTLVADLSVGCFALHQAGAALQDEALSRAMELRMDELLTETEWLHRQIRDVAAQALVVPSLD